MAEKTVILENVSKRLWIMGAISITPTEAVAVPESVFKQYSVQQAIEAGELKVGEELKEPKIVTDEAEARRIQAQEKRNANKGK